MSDGGAELVYAVPRDMLFGDVVPWLGVKRDGVDAIFRRADTVGRYVSRPEAETDASLKQIIPYLVLRDGDRIFLMKRTRAGGDPRLHDLFTVGIGGHLNPGDGGILGGLEREWREEIDANFMPEFEYVGLLNDDTVDVGRHHLGIVYVADSGGGSVEVREIDKLSGSFEGPDGLRDAYDRMETWSQLALDAVVGPDLRPSMFRPAERPNSE